MSKVLWANLALFVGAMSACATAQNQQHAERGASHPAGQAAQPGSWTASADAPTTASGAEAPSAPAGQAAQQFSWIGEPQDAPRDPTQLAQDGPSYLGGRAGQPSGWPTQHDTRTSSLAAAPATARQH